MSARWVSLLAWAAVAASAVFWGLRVFVQAPAAPPQARLADPSVALRGDLTRLLGADAPVAVARPAPVAVADPRFTLIGVASPRDAARGSREGVALIATDGKPARAYRVGATVDGDHVLQSVSQRGAQIGPRGGPPAVALELPPPAPPATGRPGPGAAAGAAGVPALPRLPAPAERRNVGAEPVDPVQSADSSEERPPQALPAPPIGPATR
ncbi:MAG: hypothetical protein KF863_05465 [Rubrivivax sp.]|nr:hypothetical protein [Rubrivivax sp.]